MTPKRDRKDRIQKIAEEMARSSHNCEFHELSQEHKDQVWTAAEIEDEERQMDKADNLRKEVK